MDTPLAARREKGLCRRRAGRHLGCGRAGGDGPYKYLGTRPFGNKDLHPNTGHRRLGRLMAQMADRAILRRCVDMPVPDFAQGRPDHKRQDGDRDNKMPSRSSVRTSAGKRHRCWRHLGQV